MFILIDSRNRIPNLSTSTSDFTIQLNNFLQGDKVSLKDIQIPNTVYNIREGINDFMVWNRLGVDFDVQIPPGKYAITELLSVIQTEMNIAEANNYVLTYDINSMKTTITGDNTFILNFATNPEQRSLYYELGFNYADTPTAPDHTGDNVIQLQRPVKILMQIKEFGTLGLTDQGIPFTFVIHLNGESGGIISYTESIFYPQDVKVALRNFIKTLTIRLTYEDGSLADLNGADFTLLLELEHH